MSEDATLLGNADATPTTDTGTAEGGADAESSPEVSNDAPEQSGEAQADANQDAGDGQEKSDAPQGAPEAYEDFTLPEGMPLDEPSMGEFKTLAKELNLSQQQAQKLVDLEVARMQAAEKSMIETEQKQTEEWVNAVKADPDIGGAKLESSLKIAKQAVTEFGGEEIASLLETTGLGNHPAVIKMFHKIGKAVAEDSVERGKATAPVRDAAYHFYPSMRK